MSRGATLSVEAPYEAWMDREVPPTTQPKALRSVIVVRQRSDRRFSNVGKQHKIRCTSRPSIRWPRAMGPRGSQAASSKLSDIDARLTRSENASNTIMRARGQTVRQRKKTETHRGTKQAQRQCFLYFTSAPVDSVQSSGVRSLVPRARFARKARWLSMGLFARFSPSSWQRFLMFLACLGTGAGFLALLFGTTPSSISYARESSSACTSPSLMASCKFVQSCCYIKSSHTWHVSSRPFPNWTEVSTLASPNLRKFGVGLFSPTFGTTLNGETKKGTYVIANLWTAHYVRSALCS